MAEPLTFDERIRQDPPPVALEAIDVEFHSLSRARFDGPHFPSGCKLTTFSFQGAADAKPVTWFRWVDSDGDRFYLHDEFMRRAAA